MKKKITYLLSLVVVILLIAGLYSLGYIYGGIKNPEQKAGVSYKVCGSELMTQFSEIDTGIAEKDYQLLKDLATRIKKINHNDEDPTCQTMLFVAAFRMEDYQQMRQPLEKIQRLYVQGIFADSNLVGGYTLNRMQVLSKQVLSETR
jgi:hypothetical protein